MIDLLGSDTFEGRTEIAIAVERVRRHRLQQAHWDLECLRIQSFKIHRMCYAIQCRIEQVKIIDAEAQKDSWSILFRKQLEDVLKPRRKFTPVYTKGPVVTDKDRPIRERIAERNRYLATVIKARSDLQRKRESNQGKE